MTLITRCWVLALSCLCVTSLNASDELDLSTAKAVVHRLADEIEARYVEAELGQSYAQALHILWSEGEMADLQTTHQLARYLTDYLDQKDWHFSVSWSDGRPNSRPPSPVGSPQLSPQHNYGFKQVEILPGNISYLDLRYFDDPALAEDKAVHVMAVMANSQAAIIDLRHNGGGDPRMVGVLASYFLGPEPVHFNSLYWREGDELHEFRTMEQVTGKRMLDIPVYVLVSGRTGSAAEDFAYSLQAQKRITVIGERTVGAANPGWRFDLGHGFSAFIPTGKAINPITGGNWEKTGVLPDIEVQASVAKDYAYNRMLERLLAAGGSENQQQRWQWILKSRQAFSKPHAMDAERLDSIVGQYGDRRIAIEDGELTYQRGRRMIHKMAALAEDTFLVENHLGLTITVQRDAQGAVTGLLHEWMDGRSLEYHRDSAS